MKTHAEKRACERHCYAADIAFSYLKSLGAWQPAGNINAIKQVARI